METLVDTETEDAEMCTYVYFQTYCLWWRILLPSRRALSTHQLTTTSTSAGAAEPTYYLDVGLEAEVVSFISYCPPLA
jgi:hypothetical protein